MRKVINTAAIIAVVLSSCSMEFIEDVSTNTGNHISFNAYLQRSNLKQSNSNSDIAFLQANGFVVNAFNTGVVGWNNGGKAAYTQILDEQQVLYTNGAWSYAPPILWPNNDKVSFFAHSPANDNSFFGQNANDDGYIFFIQKKTRREQHDLLVSYLLDNTKANINSDGRLGFSMKHALARVGFKAKYIDSPNIASVEVSDIVIKYSGAIQTTGIFKLTGNNSLDGGGDPWGLRSADGISAQEVIAGPIAVSKDGFDYILDSIDGSTTFNPSNSKNFVLLIPQEITPGVITISMTIIANRVDGTAESWTITDRDLFAALNNRGSTSLQSGKAYDFTFNFNVDHSTVDPNDPTTPMDPDNVLIRFDVTEIVGWDVSPGDLPVTN
jgi:hypothetical protein